MDTEDAPEGTATWHPCAEQPPPGGPSPSLRLRKKLATREALSIAALRLTLERGLVNVRVDDIAAAAGVSTRTYNNYFSSREEAICALAVDRGRRVGDALRTRPAGEPLGVAITAAVLEEYAGPEEPEREMVRMFISTPALRGEYLKSIAEIERPLAAAVAERTGVDVEQDLFPRLVAAAVTGATRAATVHWLREDNRTPYRDVVRAALAHLEPMANSFQILRAQQGTTVTTAEAADDQG